MTTEPGSDELFAELADTSAIGTGARWERLRALVEEWRLRAIRPSDEEPGVDYPDVDEAPPADERHAEFDPLPPPPQGTSSDDPATMP